MKTSCLFVLHFISLIFFSTSSLGALTTREALSNFSEEKMDTFLKEKRLLEIAKKKRPVYFPSFIFAENKAEIDAEIKNISPNILIEGLYLIPKRSSLNMLYFYNSLLSVSAFKDVTYFNEKTELTQPLLGYSYMIASRDESETELADPLAKTLEPSKEILVYQDFLPYSPTVSRYSYANDTGQLRFKALALDRVQLRGNTGIKPEKFVFRILVQETDDSFVVYALAYARVTSFFGIGERLFTYRIKGLLQWYFNNYLAKFY